jgi:ferrous iron transport protein A
VLRMPGIKVTKNNPNGSAKMITLDKIPVGRQVRVEKIEGGHVVRQRLNQLGIHNGDLLRVKRGGPFGGPVLVTVHNTHVAIGRGMAGKISVIPAERNEIEDSST